MKDLLEKRSKKELESSLKNLVITPKGIGEIKHEGKAGTIAEIDGKQKSFNPGDVEKLSEEKIQDVEQALRHVVDSIPENLKSTNLQSIVYVPIEGVNLMLSQFYDGKWAWYLDVPEETYRNISMGTYEPKTEGQTGIAQYKPGVADSRGAGFSKEIVQNPKYSKENKGVTWGYADSEYNLLKSLQPLLHKISKGKKDEFGNVKEPKQEKRKPLKEAIDYLKLMNYGLKKILKGKK